MSSKVLAVDMFISAYWINNTTKFNGILALIWTRNFLIITTILGCFMSIEISKLSYPIAAFKALGAVDIAFDGHFKE
jgi:hypothetical protein